MERITLQRDESIAAQDESLWRLVGIFYERTNVLVSFTAIRDRRLHGKDGVDASPLQTFKA